MTSSSSLPVFFPVRTYALCADRSFSIDLVTICRQLTQPHRPAGMDLLCGDADLRAKAKLMPTEKRVDALA